MSMPVKNLLARFDPAWRTALGVFIFARLFYFLWSLVILNVYPLAVQNMVLNGSPVLTAFDLSGNRGYLYNRQVEGQLLTFRATGKTLIDTQTSSRWDLVTGKAISGKYLGQNMLPVEISISGVFPYQGVDANPTAIFSVWQRFDTNWYLKIAQSGYSESDGSTAFFPLYPLLIKIFGLLIGDNLISALVISNAAFLGAMVLLYKLTDGFFETRVVERSLLYIVLFPTSFFFFAGYSESLFLLLVLAALYEARQKKWLCAGLFGSLAALTRLQGILIMVPLFYLWWLQKEQRRWVQALILPLIPISSLCFLLYTRFSLIETYNSTLSAIFVWPWMNFWAAARLLLIGKGSPIDVLNISATILFGILCVFGWHQLPREWFLYSITMFITPLFRMTTTQPLVSMSRYVLVLFPLFCLLGKWGQKAWVNRLILYAGLFAALYFSAQFFSWGWVA